MNQTIKTIVLACFITFFHLPAQAVSEQEAASADRRGDFSVAAEAYKQLVALNPSSAALRLKYADVLAKNREWNAAINEYETMLKLHPNNTEAVLGIATVRRWQGNIREAKRANEQARLLSPTHSDPVLGLAATYALDHDFDNAGKLYSQAVTTWPADTGVKHAAYIFQRQRNPRLYLFWENDLSFESRQAGVNIPFGGREEIGVEYQDETSIAPALGNARIYTRSDKKAFYTHYFGLNHMLDFSARTSEYQYNVTIASYTGIDTYQEYRFRYTVPLMLKGKNRCLEFFLRHAFIFFLRSLDLPHRSLDLRMDLGGTIIMAKEFLTQIVKAVQFAFGRQSKFNCFADIRLGY